MLVYKQPPISLHHSMSWWTQHLELQSRRPPYWSTSLSKGCQTPTSPIVRGKPTTPPLRMLTNSWRRTQHSSRAPSLGDIMATFGLSSWPISTPELPHPNLYAQPNPKEQPLFHNRHGPGRSREFYVIISRRIIDTTSEGQLTPPSVTNWWPCLKTRTYPPSKILTQVTQCGRL